MIEVTLIIRVSGTSLWDSTFNWGTVRRKNLDKSRRRLAGTSNTAGSPRFSWRPAASAVSRRRVSAKPGSKGCPQLSDLTEFMNSKDTKDPWGEEYVLKCGGDLPAGLSPGSIAVYSKGPDGKDGTGDDIKSWE